MHRLFSLVFFLFTTMLFAQQDTLVVTDYTSLLITQEKSGEFVPATRLSELTTAGFFLTSAPEKGGLRICSDDAIFLWVNGRMVRKIKNCQWIDPATLFASVPNDSMYISFSARYNLASLQCDLVVIEELKVVGENLIYPRETRNPFDEFVLIATIFIIMLLSVFSAAYPSRVLYLLTRCFTFKTSAYELTDTQFFSPANMMVALLYSSIFSFSVIYADQFLGFSVVDEPTGVRDILIGWLWLIGLFMTLIAIKWFLVYNVSILYNFKGLMNLQLFDFINVNTILFIPVILTLFLEYLFIRPSGSWLHEGFILVFPLILIVYVAWFTWKFINNSTRRKLIIISYLCATEIIPAILLLGWFYKKL